MSRESKKRRAERRLHCRYLGNKCANCGETVEEIMEEYGEPVVSRLQFNHVDPSKKHPKYKRLMEKPICLEQLNEMDKCVLLCAGCHTTLTLQRIEGEVTFNAIDCGMPISQTLKIQGILRMKSRILRCFIAELPALWYCGVRIGAEVERLVPAHELDTAQNLGVWLRAIEEHKEVVIRRASDGYVFMTIRLHGERVRIDYDTSIALPRTHLTLIDENKKTFWVRRGKVIDKQNLTISDSSWVEMECDYKDAVAA